MDMPFFETIGLEALTALLSVIVVDIALAGDNAIVVGMAAAGLPAKMRNRAIAIGILAAAGMRIIFALMTTQLLQIVGLMVAGGILLLWVAWKLWRETSQRKEEDAGEAALEGEATPGAPTKTFRSAVTQIVVADLSMSLDNVLAVAGAAMDHPTVLIFGLALSVLLMGFAATIIARYLHRYPWIAQIGLAVILVVAIRMIWDGTNEVLAYTGV